MGNYENANATEASRENFWSILSKNEYNICIPRIQRDYAQGREEPEPTQIRQSFIKDIFNSLKNNIPMDVNFIYGNIDQYKGAKRFIPIDGQQRLTTLFLVHWYFATWSKKLNDENKKILNRFQYETRFTTGDFCKKLVENVDIDLQKLVSEDKATRNHLDDGKKNKDSLKKVIKDYYWFFSVYEHDATIKAMLVMLQDIHNEVVNLEDESIVDEFLDKLMNQDCPISFLFLNIADVGLTDEIYIKMNARGKALTRFENFKAQLSSYLTKRDEDFSREFLGNINGLWSQFFWNEEYRPLVSVKDSKSKTEKAIVFDDQMMNLFRFIMTNEFICNVKMEEAGSDNKYLVRKILQDLAKESDFQFVNHLFVDEFRTVPHYRTEDANVDISVFRFISRLLNILAKKKMETGNICFADSSLFSQSYIDEESIFKRLIRSVSERNLNYEEQILLYAEFCFLVKFSNEDCSFTKTKELTEWLRFISNLTKNTLYNGWDDYFRSVVRVRTLVESEVVLNINQYAATLPKRTYRQGSGYGFVENQMMEECIKARLILSGEKWRTNILNAEKSFLGSQITAVLMFSGIWKQYESEMQKWEKENVDGILPNPEVLLQSVVDDGIYIQQFELYLNKLNMIFDYDSLKPEMEKDSILRRALLTYGDADSYMLPAKKQLCCFLDAVDRERSFKRLLRGDETDNIGYFKALLDDIDSKQELRPQLQRIINEMTYDEESSWKKYFIEMPEIFESMYQNKGKEDPSGNFVFLNAKRFIYKANVNKILLLEKTQTNSINREYYSYVLYLKAKKSGLDVEYFRTFSESADKYMYYVNNQDKEIHVIYTNVGTDDNPQYQFAAQENGITLYRGNMENMLDYVFQSIKA